MLGNKLFMRRGVRKEKIHFKISLYFTCLPHTPLPTLSVARFTDRPTLRDILLLLTVKNIPSQLTDSRNFWSSLVRVVDFFGVFKLTWIFRSDSRYRTLVIHVPTFLVRLPLRTVFLPLENEKEEGKRKKEIEEKKKNHSSRDLSRDLYGISLRNSCARCTDLHRSFCFHCHELKKVKYSWMKKQINLLKFCRNFNCPIFVIITPIQLASLQKNAISKMLLYYISWSFRNFFSLKIMLQRTCNTLEI